MFSRFLLVSFHICQDRKRRITGMPFAFLRYVLQILVIFVTPLDKKPLRNFWYVKFCQL